MKKIIFSLLALSMFVAVGCSEESATDFNATPAEAADQSHLTARSSVWNGVIGIEDKGVYKVTADKDILISDLEAVLRREGHATKIQSLEIIRKESSNTPGDFGYMLIGADKVRTSIGVWLTRSTNSNTGTVEFMQDTAYTASTSCTGCAMGCNLSYLTIDGRKLAYCNENGCDYDCTKSETSAF